jgi:hypothetical protein
MYIENDISIAMLFQEKPACKYNCRTISESLQNVLRETALKMIKILLWFLHLRATGLRVCYYTFILAYRTN